MSFTEKYRLQYQTDLGDTVKWDILLRDYAGDIISLTGSGDPVRIRFDKQGDDTFEAIKPSSHLLQFLADTVTQFEEFNDFDDRQYLAKKYVNGVLDWQGYLAAELFTQPVENGITTIELNAADGLGDLVGIEYIPSGRKSHLEILCEILQQTGHYLNICIGVNIWESRQNTSESPLAQTFIDTEIFRKDDRYSKTCAEVLRDILEIYTARIQQRAGRWYITRIDDMYDGVVAGREFNYLGTDQGSFSVSNLKTIGNTIDAANVQLLTGGNSYKNKAYKQFEGKQDFGKSDTSIVKNGDFTNSGLVLDVFENWFTPLFTTAAKVDLGNGNYAAAVYYSGVPIGESYLQCYPTAELKADSTKKYILKFDVLLSGFAGQTTDLEIRVFTNNYYLKVNEGTDQPEWTTTPTNIIVSGLLSLSEYTSSDFHTFEIVVDNFPEDSPLNIRLYGKSDAGPQPIYDNVKFFPIDETISSGVLYIKGQNNSNYNYLPKNVEIKQCDIPDIANNIILYKNYLSLDADGSQPTKDWKVDGVGTAYLLSEHRVRSVCNAKSINTTVFRGRIQGRINPLSVFTDYAGRRLMIVSYNGSEREGIYTIEAVQLVNPGTASIIVTQDEYTSDPENSSSGGSSPEIKFQDKKVSVLNAEGLEVVSSGHLSSDYFEEHDRIGTAVRTKPKEHSIDPHSIDHDTGTPQFSIVEGTVLPNYGADKTAVKVLAGDLVSHNWSAKTRAGIAADGASYDPTRTWSFVETDLTLPTDGDGYFIYAKVPRADGQTVSTIEASTDHIRVKADDDYLYFKLGYITAVSNGRRVASMLWGNQSDRLNLIDEKYTSGTKPTVSGNNAVAVGEGNVAYNYGEVVTGHFATISAGSQNVWVATDRAWGVGVGADDGNRAVAIEIFNDKKVKHHGKTYLYDDVFIEGDIYQQGAIYETHAEHLFTTKDFINLRDGAVAPVAVGEISGIKIMLADGVNNLLLGAGNDAIARVGWENDTLQTIATRDEVIVDNHVVYYDSTDYILRDAGYVYSDVAMKATTITGANGLTGGGDLSANRTISHGSGSWVAKTALSGANVISNLSVDGYGHPVDWITREMTYSDIGAVGGTGTSGYIPKFSGVNSITNSNLYINGNYVGINTTSAVNALDVVGADGGSTIDYAIRWRNTVAGTLGYLGADASNYNSGALHLYQNGSANTVISAAGNSYFMGGNVGIGTTNPSNTFDIRSTGDYIFSAQGTGGRGFIIANNADYASIVGLTATHGGYNAISFRTSSTPGQLHISTNGSTGFNTVSPLTGSVIDANGEIAKEGVLLKLNWLKSSEIGSNTYIPVSNGTIPVWTAPGSINLSSFNNDLGNYGAFLTSETDPVYTASSWYTTTNNAANWDAAYGWGNHAGLYRPISYVPSWSEITNNPFSFTSPTNGQLLKYNSTASKFENWTPNYLTSFTETDPVWISEKVNYYTITQSNSAYESAISKSTGYAKWTGSAWSFVNETYSLSTHDHSGVYAPYSHILSTNNPHSVTLSQLGYSGATDADNYSYWNLQVAGLFKTQIQSTNNVNFTASTGLSVDYVGSAIQYTNTAPMIYPSAGIAVSTGSAWGTSITDNSSNWNAAYNWGNWATGVTKSFIESNLTGTITSHTHNYDNYAYWTSQVNGLFSYNIGSNYTFNLEAGTGVSINYSDVGSKRTIIISAPMVYPGAGIAVSTGSAWGSSITDNSANWNAAYSWGNWATGVTKSFIESNLTGTITSHNHTGTYEPAISKIGTGYAYWNGSSWSFATPSGGTPGGTSGQIQYNNSGAFGGFGSWTGSAMTIPGAIRSGNGSSAHQLSENGSGVMYLVSDYDGTPWTYLSFAHTYGVLSLSADTSIFGDLYVEGNGIFYNYTSQSYFAIDNSSAGVTNFITGESSGSSSAWLSADYTSGSVAISVLGDTTFTSGHIDLTPAALPPAQNGRIAAYNGLLWFSDGTGWYEILMS